MQSQSLLKLQQLYDNIGNFVLTYFKDSDGQPLKLTEYQLELVKAIISRKHKRIITTAATQSGKSCALSTAIALLAILFPNERIINISYTEAQSKIIFEAVKKHLIEDSEFIKGLVDLNRTLGKSKEFSKSRMFMKNGTELRVLSTGKGETQDTAESLLGFEATILTIDEAGSIPDSIFRTKIMRMVGAKRSQGFDKQLILSGTPHRGGTYFEEAFNDPSYLKVHIDWRRAVAAGRFSESFIEEQRRGLTNSAFECWYDAIFPGMTEDSVFDIHEVERNIVSEIPTFEGVRILSVDVARHGTDHTIYTMVDFCNNIYRVVGILQQDDKTTMQVVGKIINLHSIHNFDRVLIDEVGVGGGVLDRIREQEGEHHIKAFGIIAGGKCTNDEAAKTCLNLKAELYMRAKKLFEQDKLKIIGHPQLKKELRQMRKEFQSNGKLKIIDPDKSPDYADSMVYSLHKPSSGAFIIRDTSQKSDSGLNWGKGLN